MTQNNTNATNHEIATANLHARWNALIPDELSHEGMVESLTDQVTRYQDLSADELDEELAEVMGWALPATDAQLVEWEGLVRTAAALWLVLDLGRDQRTVEGEPMDLLTAEAIAEMVDEDGGWTDPASIRSNIEDYCDR